jgi:AraC family transcriptional regulator, regulatory protein of adaptative response / methylated-DNA-[protein]-cysteine methyltransferase
MIATTKIETELGIMIAGAVDEGICLLEFHDRKMLNTEYKDLARYFKTIIDEGENKHFEILRKELTGYFEGSLKEFSVPIIAPGSDFQKSVWKELMNIPYGTTRSYLEQSVAMGIPGSIRAVANANGMNRISIIIPCHRVIGSDGHLTGYGGGLKRKKWLLDHEKKYSGKSIELTLF